MVQAPGGTPITPPGVLGGPGLQLPDAAAVKRAVHERIRRAITVGEMPPGSRLVQTQLAEALGVSRMPVRDAINDLIAEGLATAMSAGGAVVSQLSQKDMHDVYAIRTCLEIHAVRDLASRVTDEDVRTFRAIIDSAQPLIRSGEMVKALELDKEFHWAIYQATGNRFLEMALTPMWAQVERIMFALVQIPRYLPVVWAEHSSIVDALEARDADAAALSSERHLLGAARRLIDVAS